MHMKRPVFLLPALTLLLVMTAPLKANLLERFGATGKVPGRAGAGSAVVSGYSATWYNPAGLSSPYASYAGRVKGVSNPAGARKNVIIGPAGPDSTTMPDGADKTGSPEEVGPASVARPVDRGYILDDHGNAGGSSTPLAPAAENNDYRHEMGLAFSWQAPDMNIETGRRSAQAEEYARQATSDLDYGMLQAGIAVDLREVFWTPYNIPVNFGFLASLSADGTVAAQPVLKEERYQFARLGNQVRVITAAMALSLQPWKDRLSIGFSPGSASDITGQARVQNVSLDQNDPASFDVAADLNTRPAPVAALQYRQPLAVGDLYFGLTWRMSRQNNTSFEVETKLPLGFESTTTTKSTRLLSPHVFIVGSAFDAGAFTLMFDVEYQAWSTVQLAEDRLRYEEPLNYNDIAIIRLGAETELAETLIKTRLMRQLDLAARAGYSYEPSITADATTRSNRLDSTKHTFAFGLSRDFNSSLIRAVQSLDFFFSLQVWATRSAAKEDTAAFDNGTKQASLRWSGTVWQSGLAYTLKL